MYDPIRFTQKTENFEKVIETQKLTVWLEKPRIATIKLVMSQFSYFQKNHRFLFVFVSSLT